MKKIKIVLKKQNDKTFRKGIDDLPTIPVMLSEWTDLNPKNIQRMLHNANDWAGIKKGSTQSYAEAIREGHFKTKLTNEWKRMLAMDVSDVYYEKFLINAHLTKSLYELRFRLSLNLFRQAGNGHLQDAHCINIAETLHPLLCGKVVKNDIC